MTVFTIGYEGLDIDAFMALLARHDIETIVDVRELPLSRKPGFSKKTLASMLNMFGREYVHIPALGCPKPVRNRYRENGSWPQYVEGFQKYLATQGAAIVELSELVVGSNCALLCFEADFNFCHRSMVAAAVREYCGASVEHIKAVKAATKIATPAGFQTAFA